MFKHIIITKFNVRDYDENDYQHSRIGKAVLDDEWMDNRMGLFETYYLNSLQHQTCKNFYCWVFFDEKTKDKYKQQIKQLQNKYTFFEPIYIQYGKDFITRINQQLANVIDKETQFIITSRIDNDDGYHARAIEFIQANFVPQDRYAINLTKGYRLVHGAKPLLLKNSFVNGPFLSLVEKYTPGVDITTIYCQMHQEFFSKYKLKQIKSEYLWLQNIHDYNVANDLCGLPTLNKQVLKEFGVDQSTIQLSIFAALVQWLKYRINIRNYVPFELKYSLIKWKNKILGIEQ